MPLYEHVMLVRPDLSVQQAEQTVSGFKALIEDGGGKVSKVENWGLRGTAYRIKKNRKAHYSLMNIDAESELVAEMERQMRLNEDVLRFMTIAVDEHEDGPSVMMQKRDRDRDDKKRRSNGFARGPSADEQPGQRAERTPEPTAEA